MCFDLGQLREYLDGESGEELSREITSHLEACSRCRECLARLERDDSLVGEKFRAWTEPSTHRPADLENAWESIMRRSSENRNPRPRTITFFKTRQEVRSMIRRYRTAAAVAVVALCFGIAMSFGPVREAVADLLVVFRAEKITTVSITTNDLQRIQSTLKHGGRTIYLEQFGKVQVSEKIELRPTTLAEAQRLVDFTVKTPGTLPPGLPQLKMFYVNDSTASFTLKVNNVNSLLASLGSQTLLPQELDGKTFTISLPAAVVYRSAVNGSRPELTIVQSRSPELGVPDGVDLSQVRQALLSLPVLPEDLRRQLTAIEDWQSTVVIPDVDGSTRSVTVQGVKGVLITGNNNSVNCLMWIKDGVINMVQGNITADQALEIANSLR